MQKNNVRYQNLWFHILTLLGCLLEIPRYLHLSILNATSDGGYTAPLYPLHLFSMATIFISFCIIIKLWGSAIIFETNDSHTTENTTKFILVVLCITELVIIIVNSIYVNLPSVNFDDYTQGMLYKTWTFYQVSDVILGRLLMSVRDLTNTHTHTHIICI